MELFEAIRRDARREELSIRGLADRYGVHRRTVRAALASAVPPERKVPARPAPRLDPVKELIDQMLREDVGAPKKQRHTVRRICERLVEEHQVTSVSYSTVRDYVRTRRPEVFTEAGVAPDEVFIVQIHAPGAQAEVDFADLWIDLRGVRTKVFLFTLRLSYSGKAVHRAFASQSQEAFLEGHRVAFTRLGGVPTVHIRYDNLKSAVSRVLMGRSRLESQRWVAFRSHAGFDPFYCRPGKEGAHEKGGVEVEGGRFRRTHLVPVPKVESLAELNAILQAADAKDDARRLSGRTRTVAQDFAVEQPCLRPLPAEGFETGTTLWARVDRHARISVRQVRYSVPAHLIGARVRVLLRAEEVMAFEGPAVVARHERSTVRGDQVLALDHYLEVLVDKPGALPGSLALTQARAAGVFTVAHQALWTRARAVHGDTEGTRVLIEVLLLHRRLPADAVTAGIRAALKVGSTSPELVAVEARRAQARPGGPAEATVVELPVAQADRPLPCLDAYDDLLTGTPVIPAG